MMDVRELVLDGRPRRRSGVDERGLVARDGLAVFAVLCVEIAHALMDVRCRRAGLGLRIAALDRVAQRDGVAVRCDAELAVQNARALPVLTQGCSPVTRSGIETHERAMCSFIERLDRQPAPRVLDRASVVAFLMGESFQDSSELPSKGLGLRGLPLIELHAVTQRESG